MSHKVIIVTAPSGAGKTTIVKELLKQIPQIAFSVSACTRERREGEVEGRDYYFLTKEAFEEKISNNEFLEWEEVYANYYYGTLKKEVDRLWNADKVIIFDVDVKGAENLKKYFNKKALAIYIKPPSLEVLKERLKSRKTESHESLEKRIARATMELDYEDHFDLVILNDNLNDAKTKALEEVKLFIGQ